jgi:type IV pilus assembly protein PilV
MPRPLKGPTMTQSRSAQGGVMLLEAMIGILVFSLGVLALVAMQAISVSNVSNAQYRSEAAILANEIIAAAWVDRCDTTIIATSPCGANVANVMNFRYPGGTAAALAPWLAKLQGTPGSKTGLPQATNYPPTITVVPTPGENSATITVTIRWKGPDAVAPSNHVAVSLIADP